MAGTTSYTQCTHPNSDMYHCVTTSIERNKSLSNKALKLKVILYTLCSYTGIKTLKGADKKWNGKILENKLLQNIDSRNNRTVWSMKTKQTICHFKFNSIFQKSKYLISPNLPGGLDLFLGSS